VSIQHPDSEKSRASKSAETASRRVAQSGGGASVKERVDADVQLLQRCLDGNQRAWERLYRKCHPRLRKAIEVLLGADAADIHVIEEIAARVWYAVLKDNCRLLETYDPERDSGLDSFLMGLARIEILRYARSERRRHAHELSGGRKRLEERRVSDWQLASMMEEFTSTLTPGERAFLERFLTGAAEQEPGPDPEPGDLPPTTVWTRRYRIRRKLDRFLDNL
jgi:DNA-directed RNA polymerase specialized sigma24 family protein